MLGGKQERRHKPNTAFFNDLFGNERVNMAILKLTPTVITRDSYPFMREAYLFLFLKSDFTKGEMWQGTDHKEINKLTSHNLFGNAMLLFGTKDSNWNMTFKFSCRSCVHNRLTVQEDQRTPVLTSQGQNIQNIDLKCINSFILQCH